MLPEKAEGGAIGRGRAGRNLESIAKATGSQRRIDIIAFLCPQCPARFGESSKWILITSLPGKPHPQRANVYKCMPGLIYSVNMCQASTSAGPHTRNWDLLVSTSKFPPLGAYVLAERERFSETVTDRAQCCRERCGYGREGDGKVT